MSLLANAKAVAGAVICGTGATSGLVLYPLYGAKAVWIAVLAIAAGFAVAAWPVGRKR
jgi:hypothetical protein